MSEPTPEMIDAGFAKAAQFTTVVDRQELAAIYTAMRALERPSDIPFAEGVEHYPLRAWIWKREGEWREQEEWVLELAGEINGCSFVARHTEPLTTAPEDVAGLPSLYSTERPSDEAVQRVARRIQLWWMTQKHEPMHQNDAQDLARAAIAAMQEQSK